MRISYGSIGILSLALACSRAPSTSVAASQRQSRQAAMLAAALDTIYGHQVPSNAVLRDSTVVFRAPGGEAVTEWRMIYESIPEELRAKLVLRNSRPSAVSAISSFPHATLIDRAILDSLFRRDINQDGWAAFQRRFPGASGYLAMTIPVFTSDSAQAALYYEYHCGYLCGEGVLIWLVRREDGQWSVQRTLRFWVS